MGTHFEFTLEFHIKGHHTTCTWFVFGNWALLLSRRHLNSQWTHPQDKAAQHLKDFRVPVRNYFELNFEQCPMSDESSSRWPPPPRASCSQQRLAVNLGNSRQGKVRLVPHSVPQNGAMLPQMASVTLALIGSLLVMGWYIKKLRCQPRPLRFMIPFLHLFTLYNPLILSISI